MPSKAIFLPEIGEISVYKRRGAKNLRLSITASGEVRITIPHWTPYSSATAFALARSDWIKQRRLIRPVSVIQPGDRIGKSHRIYFNTEPSVQNISSKITPNRLEISSTYGHDHRLVQAKAILLAEKALRLEAQKLLPRRLETLAKKHGFTYRSVRVRKLTSRWGSCSANQDITLSFYLMQLPWELIDYVIIHELMHTRHMHHGQVFWEAMEKLQSGSKNIKKHLSANLPRVESYSD